MKLIPIKITLLQTVLLSEEAWNDFGELLPEDMEDLEMLQDQALTYETELVKAQVVYREEESHEQPKKDE